MVLPRSEHPKPQFARDSWMNLNGLWEFEIDHGQSGEDRGYGDPDHHLSGSITVPFCPESALSGVGYKDFIASCWYRRSVTLSETQVSGRTFLHFGAVDYACTVYVNGQKAGTHKGGYVSFSFEITSLIRSGENVITVWAKDDNRNPMIPRGKQSELYYSHQCDYTRTTGIWQTVWLEFTPPVYLRKIRMETDCDAPSLILKGEGVGAADFRVVVTYEGDPVGTLQSYEPGGCFTVTVPLSEKHLWEPGHGRLYDVELTYGCDTVKTYFGLRSIRLTPKAFYLNEKPVFQRLVLDQGFYPDGVYTAPSDEELHADVLRSMALGFNGARLHEKVFEERFLYHADREGYLVWGEFPNWGLDHTKPESIFGILPEWLEEISRDCNHPSIIGWCPFNETWDVHGCPQYDDVIHTVYLATKAADPARPCIDTSGNFHIETDIFDVHDYEQDPVVFRKHYDELPEKGELYSRLDDGQVTGLGVCEGRQEYHGEPVMMSEFGGIKWTEEMGTENSLTESWGYGKNVADVRELKARFQGLCDALLDNPRMLGFCYTQLTDVEQEKNGLYTYDRKVKFDPDWVRSVVSREAAMERKDKE